MSTIQPPTRVVTPEEATVYQQLHGEQIRLLLSATDSGGAFALMYDETPPGGGPPLHVHRREDEIFYVLEGALQVLVDGREHTLNAGSCAFLPRGVPHTFTNRGPQAAHTLCIISPAGLEGFFAEVEPLVARAEPDMAAVMGVAAKYGIEVLGPPMAG